jgi:hypothetical protein
VGDPQDEKATGIKGTAWGDWFILRIWWPAVSDGEDDDEDDDDDASDGDDDDNGHGENRL